MLCRRRGETDTVDLNLLPPVQLHDAVWWNAPVLEAFAHAERCEEGRRNARLGERDDGPTIEMIVVVVRDDDGVELRERIEPRRRRMKALGARERQGRSATAPHRVSEDAHSIDLDEQRRVAQPRDAKAGR